MRGSPLPAPLSALVCVLGFCRGFMMSGRECRVQMAGAREKRSRAGGREGERERCVVALIWSAILVSTNQGLPVPRGA